jgi:uncharacterized protein (DUF111 family)
MKVLFLDCFSGISGDMTVGALVDLGVKPSTLEWELSKLDIGDFHMHFERQKRQNIEGVKFGIHEGATHTHEQDEPHDHGHEHAHDGCCGHDHGHEHSHAHAHSHEHEHGHTHSHEHEHSHTHEHEHAPGEEHHHEHGDEAHAHEHAHPHGHDHDHDHGCEVEEHHHHHGHEHGRSHRQIRELIEHSELSPFVKKHALAIFQRVAVAEGKIHGQPAEDVEFHEVGALDSIADIVSACVGIEALGVEKVFVSSLHDGHGTVSCAHGTFPVPTPATLEILQGIPVGQIDEPHELITPTGAAIVAEFGVSFGPMPQIKSEKIGYGLGTRDLASRPNVLRAVLGELVED